jgi:hypothetical protein
MEWVFDNRQKRKRLIKPNWERFDMLDCLASGDNDQLSNKEGILRIEYFFTFFLNHSKKSEFVDVQNLIIEDSFKVFNLPVSFTSL